MTIQELWSEEDKLALERFERARDRHALGKALFAIEGISPGDAARGLAELEVWGERCSAAVASDEPLEAALALSVVLGDLAGFRGDDTHYYGSRNSMLSQVLQRRRGLPILLSAVWIIVGEHAGFEMEGVGMPGHFIVRVCGEEEAPGVLVDPFRSGRVLTADQCHAIVDSVSRGKLPWSERFLDPVTHDRLLQRVLHNLLNSYRMERDTMSIYRTLRFLLVLQPESSSLRLLFGTLSEQLGAFSTAEAQYVFILTHLADSDEASLAQQLLTRLEDKKVHLN